MTTASRIVIADLPAVEQLSPEEIARIFGAGLRARLGIEGLEGRDMLSASALSTLGGDSARFDLTGGHVVMTQSGHQTDLGTGVVQLYQGRSPAGQSVAYEWMTDHTLREFDGHQFVKLDTADQIVQDAAGSLLYLHEGGLKLATGQPGTFESLLANVRGLTANGDHFAFQVGSLVKGDVAVRIDAATGTATATFSNVQVNVGGFVNGVVSQLRQLTGHARIQELATMLSKPLVNQGWAKDFTAIKLLDLFGYHDAAVSAEKFAKAVTAVTNLPANTGGWASVGGFTAQASTGAPLTMRTDGVGNPDFRAVTSALLAVRKLDGLRIGLDDGHQFLALLTGQTADLFSYTLALDATVTGLDKRLATIPISPETATELDLDLIANVQLHAAATFGFDTTGLQTGKLTDGFFVQGVDITAKGSIGLAGTINEAYLAGYRLTGQITGTLSAELKGRVHFSTQTPNFQFKGEVKPSIETKTLGPKDLLGKYVNVDAVKSAAAEVQKAYGEGSKLVYAAGQRAQDAAAAHTAKLVSGLDATASATATVLQGLYSRAAADTATAMNDLANAGKQALAQIRGPLTVQQARLKNSVENEATHIAGVLKGLYGQQSSQIVDTLNSLKVGIDAVVDALHRVEADAQKVIDVMVGQVVRIWNETHTAGQITHVLNLLSEREVSGVIKQLFGKYGAGWVADVLYPTAGWGRLLEGLHALSFAQVTKVLDNLTVDRVVATVTHAFDRFGAGWVAAALYPTAGWDRLLGGLNALTTSQAAKVLDHLTVDQVAAAVTRAFDRFGAGWVAETLWAVPGWGTMTGALERISLTKVVAVIRSYGVNSSRMWSAVNHMTAGLKADVLRGLGLRVPVGPAGVSITPSGVSISAGPVSVSGGTSGVSVTVGGITAHL